MPDSHTCGACANFSASGKPGIKEYVATGVVSFEQRNLIREPLDLTIAALVRCGAPENMQTLSDMAWANLNQTFQTVQANNAAYAAAEGQPINQRFLTIAQAAGLIDFFAARGLSADQQRACLTDGETIQGIAENSEAQRTELGINSTPTFLINGTKVDALSWGELEPLLQRAGARP